MLTKSEVEHIANLARIELTDQEVKKYQQQLGKILDYMEKLKEVKIDNLEIESEKNNLENVWREDIVNTQNAISNTQENENNLIAMAPSVEKGQIKVKSVF